MTIREATFVVTDTETTGLKPESHRIIEIGATKVRDGTITDRFQQLVNPGRSIPGRITQLTGITTGMVFDAPPIEEVLPEYLDFLGDGILTAHNLSFDKSFLDAELERIGRGDLSNDTLCTVRLARRLLPGLKSKGLSSLVQFYGIDVNGRHRALGDADATSIVLRRLLNKLSFEHEIDSLDELLAFQNRSYQSVREVPSHLQDIRENRLPQVPTGPGTYTLKNGNGTPLYIGKAKNLANRLQSHFTAVESKSARRRTMLQKVRSIDWQTTGTELEALLRESHRIKTANPWYNRAQCRYYRRPFIRLDVSKEYPTVSWTRTFMDDGALYYGPVRNADRAEMVVDVVNRFFRLRECEDEQFNRGERCLYADMERCTAPCVTSDKDTYEAVVTRVKSFLAGQDETVVTELRERMEQASKQYEFEKAAEFRDTVEHLEPILDQQRVMGGPIRRRNLVLVHQPEAPDRADVLFVRYGRFQASVQCEAPLAPENRSTIHEVCRSLFDAHDDPPTDLSKRVVHEIRLLAQWVSSHREDLRVVRWRTSHSAEEMVHAIESAVSEPVEAGA